MQVRLGAQMSNNGVSYRVDSDFRETAYTANRPASSTEINRLWPPIASLFLVAVGLFASAGFRVSDNQLPFKAIIYLIAASFAYVQTIRIPESRLGLIVTGLLQMIAVAAAAMMLTYSAATLDRPLIDRQLLFADEVLGYHWESVAVAVHANVVITTAMSVGYAAIFSMPLIAVGALGIRRDAKRISQYITATAIALIITVALFALFPASTAWNYLGVSPSEMLHLKLLPTSANGWERDLLNIREGHGFVLPNMAGSGLIAFPSYHCIAGLLFGWTLWPVRRLRLFAIVLGAATISAAPIVGGHYLTDLIAGGFVAVISIKLSSSVGGRPLA